MTSPAQPNSPNDGFLATFFGTGNLLDSEQRARLGTLVERLRENPPRYSILPRVTTDVPSRRLWYGIAFNDSQLRRLREDLVSSLGLSLSSFSGIPSAPAAGDAIEAAIDSVTGGRWFKLKVDEADATRSSLRRDAIRRLRAMWETELSRATEAPRPTSRLLHDFQMAVQGGSIDRAQRCIDELQRRHLLDAVNLLWLRIRMLDGIGLHQQLLSLRELPDALRMRRPIAVTESILSAVYERELAPYELAKDPAGAVAAFRSVVRPVYGTLIDGLAIPHRASSVLLAALDLTIRPSPQRDQIDRIRVAASIAGPRAVFVEALLNLIAISPPPKASIAISDIRAALQAGDFGEAFRLAPTLADPEERLEVLVQCAEEGDDLAVQAALHECLASLSDAARTRALSRRRIQRLVTTTPLGTPQAVLEHAAPLGPASNWSEWLERLYSAGADSAPLDQARRGAVQWTMGALMEKPGQPDQIVAQLQTIPSSAAQFVDEAVPYLLETVLTDPAFPRRECEGLYLQLADRLNGTCRGGLDDLHSLLALIRGVLERGPSRYADLCTIVELQVEQHGAPRTLSWVLDALEAFVLFPCPDASSREGIRQAVVRCFHRHISRATRSHWTLLSRLLQDLKHPEDFEAFQPSVAATTAAKDPLESLRGRTIAVYTLDEGQGRRIAEGLIERIPQIQVRLNHDFVATTQLTQLSRNADVFVMITRCATHAATIHIEATRPKDKLTVLPEGRGASSVLAALEAAMPNG
jgi:hypothetical protein